MLRRIRVMVAVLTLGVVFSSVAPAVASFDVIRRGRCSDGARWRLALTEQGRRIEMSFRVRRSVLDEDWGVRLRHNGDLFSRGRVSAGFDGDFVVEERVRDRSGIDKYVARSESRKTGETCKGTATI